MGRREKKEVARRDFGSSYPNLVSKKILSRRTVRKNNRLQT